MLQEQIDLLTARLDALENASSVELTVDCNAGESAGAALDSVPIVTPVEITVEGLCNESLIIRRDNVVIQGADQADGFVAPPGGGIGFINGPSRVYLRDMTIHAAGAVYGVGCFGGSAVETPNLTIPRGSFGYLALVGGQCRVVDGLVDGANNGILASRSGLADIEGSAIVNSIGPGILAISGSSITVQNSANGVATQISNNAIGVSVRNGSGEVDCP